MYRHIAEREYSPPLDILSAGEDPSEFLTGLYLPMANGVFLAADAGAADRLRARYGVDAHVVIRPAKCVLAAIERRFRESFRRQAVSELAENEPQFSAATVITKKQARVFLLAAAGALVLFILFPRIAAVAITWLFIVAFVANAAFRAFLLLAGERPVATAGSAAPDEDLPIYSILVPLYREANVMPALARALRALDYPKHLLDIKFIVEIDDAETAVVADAIAARELDFQRRSRPAWHSPHEAARMQLRHAVRPWGVHGHLRCGRPPRGGPTAQSGCRVPDTAEACRMSASASEFLQRE